MFNAGNGSLYCHSFILMLALLEACVEKTKRGLALGVFIDLINATVTLFGVRSGS